MALVKKPVNGMKDVLPAEAKLRAYVTEVIRKTYEAYGFLSIETPLMEHLDNLLSKQGGDNEKLIFKVLKRGEKLKLDAAKEENDLCDMGLRYDLTVPLVRYYSCHKEELMTPFKALQMGYVFRADRPQRGRYRQFMQCDIDILGEPTALAEIELITATGEALSNLGFNDFVVRINDRRLLKAMASYAGFPDEALEGVFITLDKMDKIGTDGVLKELTENGLSADAVERYLKLFAPGEETQDGLQRLANEMGDALDKEVADSLNGIISKVCALNGGRFRIVFDPTLVRGMGYYTGTIFEVALPEYGGSCGGGGRYDKMVEKFTGQPVEGCGFSIGFERIILLLTEQGFTVPEPEGAVAFLIEKGVPDDVFQAALQEAAALRNEGKRVFTVRMNKNKKFQKEQLTKAGYTTFKEYYKEALR